VPANEQPNQTAPLKLFSVVIPARDEEESLPATLEHLHLEFSLNQVPHEIVVVDDGSQDGTWAVLQGLTAKIPELRPVQNPGDHGFGRAIVHGLRQCTGDAVVIMMADESDDARDAVRYWQLLNEGWDCVFGSRFVKGGGTIDYPPVKLFVNRLANFFIRCLFRIPLNDTTNAFKAYRRTVIQGCEPLIAPHFNLTVELPLKAMVRRSPGATGGSARRSSRSRKWAAATCSSAPTCGWKNTSAAATTKKDSQKKRKAESGKRKRRR